MIEQINLKQDWSSLNLKILLVAIMGKIENMTLCISDLVQVVQNHSFYYFMGLYLNNHNTRGKKKQPSVATHKKPDHFDQLPLVRNKFIQFRREGSSLLMITSQLKSNLDKNKLTTVLSNNICKKVGMRQKTKQNLLH